MCVCVCVFSHQHPKLIGASVAPDSRIRSSSMLLLLTTRNLELGNLENISWTKLNCNTKHLNVCYFVGRKAYN